jgi:hypothetical protein
MSPRLTTEKLRELLGDAELERLTEKVAPTPRFELYVTLKE